MSASIAADQICLVFRVLHAYHCTSTVDLGSWAVSINHGKVEALDPGMSYTEPEISDLSCGSTYSTYRVTLVVVHLGWVDLYLGCSTILLGQ